MELGATFSHIWLESLNIKVDEALVSFKSLGLVWMRVCCYWSEIESKEGQFDFRSVKKIIKFCQKNKINVILTVGMKAPRYPEYFFPSWINKDFRYLKVIKNSDKELSLKVLRFVSKTVNEFKTYEVIKIWQVENEPFDPSGKKFLSISESLVEEEVDEIKRIDPVRKILITLWGNSLVRRGHYVKAIKLADIVGLDFYFKVPSTFPFFRKYSGIDNSYLGIKRICNKIRQEKRNIFIAELQTEPWEKGELVSEDEIPESFKPTDFKKNLDYAAKLKADVVLFWGFEYWLWRKKNGNPIYWNEAKKVIKKYKL